MEKRIVQNVIINAAPVNLPPNVLHVLEIEVILHLTVLAQPLITTLTTKPFAQSVLLNVLPVQNSKNVSNALNSEFPLLIVHVKISITN